MAEGPTFSVIVPAFNYGRFMAQCIESVLAQTFQDWELVITDDQSTDDTEAVVRAYADPRIRYHRNERRLGMYPNFRRAVELSRGRLVKALPADDFLLPSCLAQFDRLFSEHPTVVMASCGVRVVDWQGSLLSEQVLPRSGELLDTAAVAALVAEKGCVFGGNAMYCFRRDAYDAVGGYPPGITYSGDFALAANLARYGNYMASPEILVGGRIHGSQSGVRDTRKTVHIDDRFRIYDLLFASHPKLRDAASLRHAARRRELGVHTAIGLKALANPLKRDWAKSVLACLRRESSVAAMLAAVVIESPRLVSHVRRARRATSKLISAARNESGTQLPAMEPDPSVGRAG